LSSLGREERGRLDTVLRPGRYINREWNAVHKEWTDGMLKVVLCFPDIYEIGMSHLGMKIIYGVLNQEKDVICERVFAPWIDMEKVLRQRKDPLLSLEGKRKLKEFDILGFSLQYEMNFTDVLNVLDLGQIPVLASEREDNDPVVIAGGPCCFNPEPLADFIDVFVIGEAEEVVLEIARLAQGWRLKAHGSRDKFLKELSRIDGIYIPRYPRPDPSRPVKKRIIADLDNAFFPTKPIVPYIQIVHDRISLEVMRGCPNRCRFCQARKIFHPLRIRSVKKLLEIAEESVKNTGYEEISLLSLSTSDYPYLEELVRRSEEMFRGRGIKLSLPSIRAQSFKGGDSGGAVKRAGLTFAPEAGSDRLRERLCKDMTNDEIVQKARLALKSGWRKVKLYFMIGLPGETQEDLDAIVGLSSEISRASLSVSPFIPKPHSGFEMESMEGLDALKAKREYLRSRFNAQKRTRNLKIDFHDPETSVIEAALSRGDRRMGGVIQKAWQKGARLQAWSEHFDYSLWMKCFQETGIDPEDYLKKKDERAKVPWSFIE